MSAQRKITTELYHDIITGYWIYAQSGKLNWNFIQRRFYELLKGLDYNSFDEVKDDLNLLMNIAKRFEDETQEILQD